jgi:regulator of protease activity HflC (stomatin/prohibitin superfamily)
MSGSNCSKTRTASFRRRRVGRFFAAAVLTFVAMFIVEPLLLWLARLLGFYTIIKERHCQVFMLFGKVVAVLDEPGLHFLWAKLGWKAPFAARKEIDLRLDQEYIRSTQVNSEEGAPMGISIWYEMYISDPVAYLFKNADPRGSLSASVSNSTVRCLSNMKLADMLENRHTMSQKVRAEVSALSREWGYQLGSVYIRKVHFRDTAMIKGIEEKVVNRLRQVTSAIKQDGANQVSIITSTAERHAAIEFAKAAAVRPQIVGATLERISQDPEIAAAIFEILETEHIIDGQAEITLIPQHGRLLPEMLAARDAGKKPPS